MSVSHLSCNLDISGVRVSEVLEMMLMATVLEMFNVNTSIHVHLWRSIAASKKVTMHCLGLGTTVLESIINIQEWFVSANSRMLIMSDILT